MLSNSANMLNIISGRLRRLEQDVCEFGIETSNTSDGPPNIETTIFTCGDTLRFWSKGGLRINNEEETTIIQLEPNNILIGSPQEPPADQTSPAFTIDIQTNRLHYWNPTVKAWKPLNPYIDPESLPIHEDQVSASELNSGDLFMNVAGQLFVKR